MALPQAIDIRISMLRLAPQCFAFTSLYYIDMYIYISVKMAAPWGSLTLLSFHSLCLYLRTHLTKWDILQNNSS